MAWFKTSEYSRDMDDLELGEPGLPVHEMFEMFGLSMPAWHKTPVATRKTLLQYLIYPANSVLRSSAPGVEALIGVAVLDAAWKKSEIRQGKASGLFWSLLQALEFREDVPDGAVMGGLLEEIFTIEWTAQLVRKNNAGLLHHDVQQSVRSRAWVRGFLSATDKAAWTKKMRLQGPLHSPMDNQDVFAKVQKLVAFCLQQSQPLSVEGEVDHAAFGGRLEFYRLLGLAVQHLLLIPFLNPKTLDLQVMIDPTARESLERPAVARPAPAAAVAESCHFPWMIEDIIVVLTQAGFKPLRQRTDGEMYTQDMLELQSNIAPLPEWLPGVMPPSATHRNFFASSSFRASFAVDLARRAKFIHHDRNGSWRDLIPTDKGRDFLALSAQQRVRHLAEAMIADQEKRGNSEGVLFDKPFGGMEWLAGAKSRLGNLRPIIAQTVDGYPPESYIPGVDFLRYHATQDNPYIAEARDKEVRRFLSYRHGDMGTPESLPEKWEDLWISDLRRALFVHLAGLGGVTFGRNRDGTGPVYFHVNALGRYLLGLTKELVHDQTQSAPDKPLLVQPNFEVVFVAAAPALLVLCGQFCERCGKGSVGNLLRITKKSIVRAARAGWTVERVVENLANASAKPLPANVLHEIRGWFSSLRLAQAYPCVLVECPDKATAERVCSLYRGLERPPRILEGHLVELRGDVSIENITFMLGKAGIFVT